MIYKESFKTICAAEPHFSVGMGFYLRPPYTLLELIVDTSVTFSSTEDYFTDLGQLP